MKSRLFTLTFALGLSLNVQASDSFFFNTGNVTIPDNDPNGCQDSRDLTGISGTISDVEVTLNISGGFNGDLYVWLSHGTGLSILLNRVGVSSSSSVGYGNTGFGPDAQQNNFTFDDQATQDVHFYQASSYTLNANGQLTGMWQPDGRILDPESSASSFDTAPRSNLLNVFNGLDPNGEWTLFAADLSSGNISTLTGWGLVITVVPEPSTFALVGLGTAALMISRRRK